MDMTFILTTGRQLIVDERDKPSYSSLDTVSDHVTSKLPAAL